MLVSLCYGVTWCGCWRALHWPCGKAVAEQRAENETSIRVLRNDFLVGLWGQILAESLNSDARLSKSAGGRREMVWHRCFRS